MNIAAMTHIPDSRYCFPISKNELIIRFRIAKEDSDIKVKLVHGPKYGFQQFQEYTDIEIRYTDNLYSYFEHKLVLDDVRLAYIFQITENDQIYYFSEDGLSSTYNFDNSFYNCFQMPYINDADILPLIPWTKDAVFYQIFVDRFNRGDMEKDDSYIDMDWNEIPTPKNFAGGDIEGIRKKISYLKGLGINVIYLTPIFQSISNHKYDIDDYYTIDPQFGEKLQLKKFIEEAHENGIRVILDAVFNHVSSSSVEFQDVLAYGNKSKFFNWFMAHDDAPSMELNNYEMFAGCNYMPKWNTSNTDVQNHLIEIGKYWIREFDIDGWRLDVSDEVSHVFWRKFREAVKNEKSDAILIGENWHDAYPYLMGDQYDSIMNYAFTKACLDYFAFDELDSKGMSERLSNILMRNSWQVNRMNLNLLDSHDTHRFYTQVDKSENKLLAGLALLFTFIGIPCIYYGTEIAMEGGYDPDSRRGFDWDESKWNNKVFNKVKKLITIHSDEIIKEGEINIDYNEDLLLIKRTFNGDTIELVINNGDRTEEISVRSILSSNEFDKDKNTLKAQGYVISKY
ncbi:glycoside hydrolase family 13 protein [Floricoccus penangensis]|uniref:glycoside hydrolase family 13 protein n=1 Tax=Floricoccus penangensis TaxID=1859475 RepID=UPI002041C292|nr:glycoside hydrolase family 13 protein [Floricoccus penangensis]URZ88089.1 glycoside hydrolase family 13 protein [Floricoccus penangensis]